MPLTTFVYKFKTVENKEKLNKYAFITIYYISEGTVHPFNTLLTLN